MLYLVKMCKIYLIFIYVVLVSGQIQQADDNLSETTTIAMLAEGEKKMSEYILEVLKHFRSPDPVGLPGANIPDPMMVPDTRKPIGFTTLQFQNTAVYGLSKFRILEVKAEIEAMKVTANMSIENLEAKGNCVANTFFNSVRSPFSVKLDGICTTARATLGVSREGKLIAQDINIDISFKSIAMNFEDAGTIGLIISSFVNIGGTFLFDSIKPFILKEAYTKAREEINIKLDGLLGEVQFPNSVTPLDMVIIDARKKVRAMKMDPYKLDDYNSTMGLFSVGLTNIWLTGISSFKRVGKINFMLQNNTVIADFEIGTDQLEGTTQWEVSAINDMLTKSGTASFSVSYITGRIILAQSLDTRQRPQLNDLALEIGNIQTRFDGAGTLDYIIESVVNILPNLLRYQIIDVLENPLKRKLQKELNEFDVEETINNELPKIDEIQEKGLKLSELRAIKEETIEDDFFNF